MLLEKIVKDLEDATRKQDPLVLKTLRFILSEIRYEEIDKQRKLTEEEIIQLLRREIKKRNEANELIRRGGRMDLVNEEIKKIAVITPYLPPELSPSELKKIVDETLKTMNQPQIGAAIGAVMQKVKGKADGKVVSEIVRQKLQPAKKQ